MRIVVMGTGTFAEPTFQALLNAGENVVGLVTQPDRDGGRQRGSTRQTGVGMAVLAAAHGIPVIQPESINTPDGVAALEAFVPDLLVVAAYGQILKPDVIAAPTMGAINVHASLLPKYRGASPIAHAILNGETVTGVTIIRITLGLDAGDMLARVEVPIPPRTTTGAMEATLGPVGATLCMGVVAQLKAGTVAGTKQDQSFATRAPKFTKEMGAIDWAQPAERVVNHVYAMQPWPTAFTFLHRPGKPPLRLIVTGAEAAPDGDGRVSPGSVVVVGQSLRVACGTAGVHLLEVQPAGGKRMAAGDFLRGTPIADGSRFGPEGKPS
jgi:methionyl-tRNA formyltransferase